VLSVDNAYQPRRTCLSVPSSGERFLAKARELAVDEVMLDLEDSVAPEAKPAARELAVAALRAGGWGGKLVAVRVNDVTTPWAYRDVIAVTEGAPGAVDSLILPKVSDPGAVVWLDVLLGQLERSLGLPPGQIGIEAQIEDAAGLAAVEAIAAASPRLVSLVFGPADFMASIGMRSLTVGGQPEGYAFDAHHYPLMRMLVAAKARGLQAIDGPYAKIGDTDGLKSAATASPRSATTGSGCCTRPRSTSLTTRSPRRPATTRGRCASWTPTSGPRRWTGAARSCWTAR
jgi:citrate lyase subunit beta/citryl-CoA lyase